MFHSFGLLYRDTTAWKWFAGLSYPGTVACAFAAHSSQFAPCSRGICTQFSIRLFRGLNRRVPGRVKAAALSWPNKRQTSSPSYSIIKGLRPILYVRKPNILPPLLPGNDFPIVSKSVISLYIFILTTPIFFGKTPHHFDRIQPQDTILLVVRQPVTAAPVVQLQTGTLENLLSYIS